MPHENFVNFYPFLSKTREISKFMKKHKHGDVYGTKIDRITFRLDLESENLDDYASNLSYINYSYMKDYNLRSYSKRNQANNQYDISISNIILVSLKFAKIKHFI